MLLTAMTVVAVAGGFLMFVLVSITEVAEVETVISGFFNILDPIVVEVAVIILGVVAGRVLTAVLVAFILLGSFDGGLSWRRS